MSDHTTGCGVAPGISREQLHVLDLADVDNGNVCEKREAQYTRRSEERLGL